jgi:hypothetical protein
MESKAFDADDSVQHRGIRGPRGFAHPVTAAQGIGKSAAMGGRFANPGKHKIEMVFQQMFEQATGYRIAQIDLRVFRPAENERPDFFRVSFDEVVLDVEHRKPPQVPRMGGLPRQQTFGSGERTAH